MTPQDQERAVEMAKVRIQTCETARDEGHALSPLALDDLAICRALLSSRAEVEEAQRVANRGVQIAVTLLKRLRDNPYPDINSEWAILQRACEDLLRINSRAAARAALRGETKQ